MHSSHFIGGLWGRPASVVKALANRHRQQTLRPHPRLPRNPPELPIGRPLRYAYIYTRHTLTRREIERETILRVFGFGTSCSMPCRTRFGGCVRAETSKIMLMLMAMRDHQDGDVGAVFSTSVTRQPSH